MISPADLQALVEKIDGGTKGVDLVKIGQVDFGGECVTVLESKSVINFY